MAQVRLPLSQIRPFGIVTQNSRHNFGQRPLKESGGPGAGPLPAGVVRLLQAPVDEQQTAGGLFTASAFRPRYFTATVKTGL